jgi:8-oxo-dGTP diphosphatase
LTHEIDGSTTHAAWVPLGKVLGLNRVSLVDIGLRLHSERPLNGKLQSP